MMKWCQKTLTAVKNRKYHKLKKDIQQNNALINTFFIVIFQVCNRLRWNGRRIKQKKNDPVSCIQRTSESRSTFAIKTMYTLQYTYNVFTQFTNLFCYMSWTLTCKKKKNVYFLLTVDWSWCESLDTHQRQKQCHHVCWTSGKWKNHNLYQSK